MLRIALVALATALTGCASTATVGAIDLTEDIAVEGRSVLVVATPSAFGEEAGGIAGVLAPDPPDVEAVAEWVPLDSLGAESYAAYVADVLAEALRERGEWTVSVASLGAVEIVEEPYSVRRTSRARTRPMTVRVPLRAPAAGTVDAFGADADLVVLVHDAGVGFAEGGWSMGATGGRQQDDDSVVMGADLVVWDNRAGTVLTFGRAYGGAPIESRLFSSAEERSPSGLMRVARERFVEAVEREVSGLLDEE